MPATSCITHTPDAHTMRAAHVFALFDAFAPLSDVRDLHASWDGSGVALTRGFRASPRRQAHEPPEHRAGPLCAGRAVPRNCLQCVL